MTALMIAQISVKDPDTFQQFATKSQQGGPAACGRCIRSSDDSGRSLSKSGAPRRLARLARISGAYWSSPSGGRHDNDELRGSRLGALAYLGETGIGELAIQMAR